MNALLCIFSTGCGASLSYLFRQPPNCSSSHYAVLETSCPETTVPAAMMYLQHLGVSSGCCHPPGSLLYLLGNGQSSLYSFCLFLVSPWVWSSFQYLTLPVEPRTLTQFSSNNDNLLCARHHIRHEEIKDKSMLFAVKELTIEWHFSSFWLMHPLSHNSEGRATTAPLPTPLHIHSSPSLASAFLNGAHDSIHSINLCGV